MESGEAKKSKTNLKQTTEFIAGYEVELGIEATAEPTPTNHESNKSPVTDSSKATRSGEEQKSIDVAVAQENKFVDVTQKNKPADNVPMNKSAEEKNKEKIHVNTTIAAQERVTGKSVVAPNSVDKTSSTSEVVAKKSESADPKKGIEAVKDILNIEKKAAVKEVAQAAEEILNTDRLTSLVKEALNIEKEASEAKDKVSSAVKVEVKVPLATPEVSSLTRKVDPSTTDDEVVIVKEVNAKKFGDITLSDYNSEEDDDYSLSEAETEDSLEWASETERTKAEDDLAEHKVGINYIGDALDLATEKAASFKTVQAALAVGDWILR